MCAESEPLFSIITVSYNSAKTIGKTIESLQNQQFKNFEWIVMDGNSSDATVALAQAAVDLNPIIHSESDSGIYDAMNKGIARARGKYLGFLNSDDRYLPHTLARVAQEISKVQGPNSEGIVYADMHTVREVGTRVYERREYAALEQLEVGMYIFHPATWIPRRYFEEFGGYDLRFKLAADYHWLLQAKTSGKPFLHVSESLAQFSVGGKSSQSCESYREAVIIQKELGSLHADATARLYASCKKKAPMRKLKAFLAQLPLFAILHRAALKRKWS